MRGISEFSNDFIGDDLNEYVNRYFLYFYLKLSPLDA